jgi:hypothetical protein
MQLWVITQKSESMAIQQAAINLFPKVKPLCVVILSEAKDQPRAL